MIICQNDVGDKTDVIIVIILISKQQFLGLRPRACGRHHAIPVFQHGAHAIKDIGFVIDAKDAQTAQFACHPAARFGHCGLVNNANRHIDRKNRPPPRARTHRNRMIKRPAKPLDNCKAKTKPLHIGGFRPLKAMEFAEDDFKLVLGDARPAIPNLDPDLVAPHPATDHRPAMAGIAQRVGDKVLQDTTQKPAIAFDPDITRMHCKTKPGLLRHRRKFGF